MIVRCVNVAGSVGGGAGWISRFRVNYICRDAGPDCWTLGKGGILLVSMVERSRVYVVVSIKISAKRQVRRSVSRLGLSSMICVSFSNVTRVKCC